jgi:hypothetical protein
MVEEPLESDAVGKRRSGSDERRMMDEQEERRSRREAVPRGPRPRRRRCPEAPRPFVAPDEVAWSAPDEGLRATDAGDEAVDAVGARRKRAQRLKPERE